MNLNNYFFKKYGFYIAALVLIVFKWMLFHNILPQVRYSPFDDNLYVNRAANLLSGNFFGDFNAYTLAKLPGFSYWLYLSRSAEIPYLLGINCLYILSGIYFLWPLKGKVNSGSLLLTFALYLLNPITLSSGWVLPMREPLSCILSVLMVGSCLHILNLINARCLTIHNIVLALTISFLILLREEDKLLWVYLFGFSTLIAYINRKNLRISMHTFLVTFLIPAALIIFSNQLVRIEIEKQYGLPIINDFSEGEFPKMIVAIRNVDSVVDNRLVMIPKDTIKKISEKVPEFSKIAERLPNPGPHTFSCTLQGVCREWSNGWMLWFIKQAAYDLGYTDTLLKSQQFFKKMRLEIQNLCTANELKCTQKGDKLLPPIELRWARGYLKEFKELIAMLLFPKLDIVSSNENALNASGDLIKIYDDVLKILPNEYSQVETNGTVKMLREFMGLVGEIITFLAIMIGAFALLWRCVMYPTIRLDKMCYVLILIWIYSVLRLLALAYVALYFGSYEPRIIFSTYTLLLLISPLCIWDCTRARISYQLLLLR
jgi:hypothetical protein